MQLLGIIAGFIVAAGAFYKAWPGFWKLWKAIGRVPVVIDAVVTELAPNGGNSLVDRVARIDARLHEANERQKVMLAWQDSHNAEDMQAFGKISDRVGVLESVLHDRTPIIIAMDERLHSVEHDLHDPDGVFRTRYHSINTDLARIIGYLGVEERLPALREEVRDLLAQREALTEGVDPDDSTKEN